MNTSSSFPTKVNAFLLRIAIAASIPLLLGSWLLALSVAASALVLATAVNDYAGRRPGYALNTPVSRRAALPLAA